MCHVLRVPPYCVIWKYINSIPYHITQVSRYKGYNSIRFSYANEEDNFANTRLLLPIQMYAKYLVGKR